VRGGKNLAEADLGPILNDVPRIVADVRAANVLVQRADELGRILKDKGLRMSQARDIFDELRQIESLWMREPAVAIRRIHLLRPRLAYRTKRTPALEPLADVLNVAILEVLAPTSDEEKHDRFARLMEFAEAIVAYHKYYGGGD